VNERRLVVVGTLASNPYAGMAWMHMQFAVGLRRLGHGVYYLETTSTWPYDPLRESAVRDSNYAVPYLARVAESFGLADRWVYRRSYSDKEWFGLGQATGKGLFAFHTLEDVVNAFDAIESNYERHRRAAPSHRPRILPGGERPAEATSGSGDVTGDYQKVSRRQCG
jgi:hypothetical protein